MGAKWGRTRGKWQGNCGKREVGNETALAFFLGAGKNDITALPSLAQRGFRHATAFATVSMDVLAPEMNRGWHVSILG